MFASRLLLTCSSMFYRIDERNRRKNGQGTLALLLRKEKLGLIESLLLEILSE
jgi:hypothetical protein